jgi:hypothetical protein
VFTRSRLRLPISNHDICSKNNYDTDKDHPVRRIDGSARKVRNKTQIGGLHRPGYISSGICMYRFTVDSLLGLADGSSAEQRKQK